MATFDAAAAEAAILDAIRRDEGTWAELRTNILPGRGTADDAPTTPGERLRFAVAGAVSTGLMEWEENPPIETVVLANLGYCAAKAVNWERMAAALLADKPRLRVL